MSRAAARLIALLLVAATPARAEGPVVLPVPRAVLYPGDLITASALAEAWFDPAVLEGEPAARAADEIVGRVARRILLPDRPVPIRATAPAAVVRRGARVSLLFVDGALEIAAQAQSLDAGAPGDTIRVRNLDSGLVVTGVVGDDGVVRIAAP